jgi:hypothetical protein
MNPSPKYSAGQQIQNTNTRKVFTIARPTRFMPNNVGWRYDSLTLHDMPFEDPNSSFRPYVPAANDGAFFEEVAKPQPSKKELRMLEQVAKKERAIATAYANGFAMPLPESERVRELLREQNPKAFDRLVSLAIRDLTWFEMHDTPTGALHSSVEMNNYVIPDCNEGRGHGLKCNISVCNSQELGDLQSILHFHVSVHGWTNGFGEVEICCKDLAKALGEHGIMSERQTRSQFEKETEHENV